MPSKPALSKSIKVGQVIGKKKVLRLAHVTGKYQYWEVECTICKRKSVLRDIAVKTGDRCKKCRRESEAFRSLFFPKWKLKH